VAHIKISKWWWNQSIDILMFELYSHILDYKLQFSNGVCAPSLAKWNKE